MPGGIKYAGWLITAVAVIIYVIMIGVTLPHLSGIAGGMAVFDMRPFGYDFGTAQELLTRLGAEGTAYYQNVQFRIDSAYPVLLCLTIIFWTIAAARRWQGYGLPLASPVLAAILATAVIGNAADLGENAAVSAMLVVGARAITPHMVDTASLFTLAKTFFDTIAFAALAILALGPWVVALINKMKR